MSTSISPCISRWSDPRQAVARNCMSLLVEVRTVQVHFWFGSLYGPLAKSSWVMQLLYFVVWGVPPNLLRSASCCAGGNRLIMACNSGGRVALMVETDVTSH